MPYGIPKEYGGDSKPNIIWMEKCVRKVEGKMSKRTGKPITHGQAIAICKSTLEKYRGKKKESSLYILFNVYT